MKFQADVTPESASIVPGSSYEFKPDKPIFLKKGTKANTLQIVFEKGNKPMMTARINIYACFVKGTTSKCGWQSRNFVVYLAFLHINSLTPRTS